MVCIKSADMHKIIGGFSKKSNYILKIGESENEG